MGGGGPKNTTTTTTSEPPKWAQPFLEALGKAAFGLFLPGGNLAPSPLPDQQVADFTPDQLAAFQQVRDFGTRSPLVDAGQARLTDLMTAQIPPAIDEKLQNALWSQAGTAAPDVYALQAAHPTAAPNVYDMLKQNPTQSPDLYSLLAQHPPSIPNVYDLLKQQGPPLFSGGFPQQQSPYVSYLNALFGGGTV